MPTSGTVRRILLQWVPRELQGEVHEFGAGWGTLAFALADRCPQAHIIAWEVSPVPYVWCVVRHALHRRANLEFRRRDFYTADLQRARVVVCYLFTGAMAKLQGKFAAELPTSSEVLSHTFAMRGWTPEETKMVDDWHRTRLYRYVMASKRYTSHAASLVRA